MLLNKFGKVAYYCSVAAFIFFSSCKEKEENLNGEYTSERFVETLNVEYASMPLNLYANDSDTDVDPREELSENDKATLLLADYPFNQNSRLYLTQYGRNNQTPSVYNPGDDLTSEVYAYKYQPKEGQIPNWNEYFNYAPVNPDHIIDWEHVRSIGSVGNGYFLYGFYFPGSNENPQFNVEVDQSDLSNLRKSNILGAFHQAPSLYTRLRFRLHHLMAYLKINVLVPVYEETGNTDGESNTGYLPNALQSIELLNAYTRFDINWSWPRSSDSEGPLVTLVTSMVNPGDGSNPGTGNEDVEIVPIEKETLIPYQHPFKRADGSESDMPSDLDIVDIPNIGDYQQGETGPDRCYLYTFSILFPPQSFTGNFLKFCFQNPLGVKKNYYYSGASNEFVSGELKFNNQGTLSVLTLYLPRKGNEAVLVKANVEDWRTAGASTNVTMKEK